MEKGWIKLKTFNGAIEAEIVKQMLEENGICAVLLNKQDSSYFFGRIELYVAQHDETMAEVLINSSTYSQEQEGQHNVD